MQTLESLIFFSEDGHEVYKLNLQISKTPPQTGVFLLLSILCIYLYISLTYT